MPYLVTKEITFGFQVSFYDAATSQQNLRDLCETKSNFGYRLPNHKPSFRKKSKLKQYLCIVAYMIFWDVK